MTSARWVAGCTGREAVAGGARPLFTELLSQHAEFHREAGRIARQIRPGKNLDSDALIGAGSDFARISNEVATLLLRVKREF